LLSETSPFSDADGVFGAVVAFDGVDGGTDEDGGLATVSSFLLLEDSTGFDAGGDVAEEASGLETAGDIFAGGGSAVDIGDVSLAATTTGCDGEDGGDAEDDAAETVAVTAPPAAGVLPHNPMALSES
jgi:hypothetical protein